MRRAEHEARMKEEIELHVDLATEANIRRGMSPEAARRAARLAFGAAEHFKDEARDEFRSATVAALAQDVRYAVRMARRTPSLTAVAVVTLGVAIALATSAFAAVNGILFRALPYADADRLALIQGTVRGSSERGPVSFTNAMDWRHDTKAFASLATFSCAPRLILNVQGESARASLMDVSADFFRVLSAKPLLGRLLDSTDYTGPAGTTGAIVLTYNLWRDRFGSDSSIVRSHVLLDGRPVDVAGVLPRDFAPMPTTLSCRPELYRTLASRYDDTQRTWSFLKAIARLAPTATLEEAQAELDVENARLALAHTATNLGMGAVIGSLRDVLTGPLRPMLLFVQAGALLVLLIACANVASLLLARASVRRRELAIRIAMGASRARVIRQIATECVALGAAACALGILLTIAATGAITAFAGNALPDPRGLAVDWRIIAFAVVASLVATATFGSAAAVAARDRGMWLLSSLRDGGRNIGAGRSRFRRALVGAQLAVATLVLLSGGLLARSYRRLRDVNPGFDPSGVTTARISLPDATYPRGARQVVFFQQVLMRLATRHGIVAAGAVSILPESPNFDRTPVKIVGRDYAANEAPTPDVYRVTPGYFDAMRIPLRDGRLFARDDDDRHPLVAVINETMANALFPGRRAVGRQMWTGAGNAERTIVGVVGDVYQYGLDSVKTMQLYVPHADNSGADLTLVVRAAATSAPVAKILRDAVSIVDAGVPVDEIMTMDDVLAGSAARRRLLAQVSLFFALGAISLAAIGLYGLVAFAVTQRTPEIGVRMALGATGGSVLAGVLREMAALVIAGATIGFAAAAVLSRVVSPLLFGVRVTDAVTLIFAPVVLLLVALCATAAPAMRAARVNPAIALRGD